MRLKQASFLIAYITKLGYMPVGKQGFQKGDVPTSAFKKGHAKVGGMVKGQTTKRIADWNNIAEQFKGNFTGRMLKIMENASDEDFARHYKDLLEYFSPKLLRADIKNDTKIVIQLDKLKDTDLDKLLAEENEGFDDYKLLPPPNTEAE